MLISKLLWLLGLVLIGVWLLGLLGFVSLAVSLGWIVLIAAFSLVIAALVVAEYYIL